MKFLLKIIIWLCIVFFSFNWISDRLRPDSYSEPEDSSFVAYQKRPENLQGNAPDPLASNQIGFENVQLHIFLDISGSVQPKSIIDFYRSAANKLSSYAPNMYYFATCAKAIRGSDWTTLSISEIGNWRKENCVNIKGTQEDQTNLLSPIDLLIEEINDRQKEHIVMIVTDDIHETKKGLDITLNDSSFIAATRSKLEDLMGQYSINLNLIKLTGQPHRVDRTCKTTKDFITKNFPQFEVTTSENLNSFSNELDEEVRKRLLISDFRFSKPFDSRKPDNINCQNNQIDHGAFIYDVERRATYNHDVFFKFNGYPGGRPLNLEKNRSGNAWLGFTIFNEHKFFPVVVRLESIYTCGVEGLNLSPLRAYQESDSDDPKNIVFYLPPNSELPVKIPVEVNFDNNYKDQDFDQLKVDYRVEYVGREVAEMRVVQENAPKSGLNRLGDEFIGNYTQFCDTKPEGNLSLLPLLSTTKPWPWWTVIIFILGVILAIILIRALLPPSISGWKIFLGRDKLRWQKFKKNKRSSKYTVSSATLNGALPNHLTITPGPTKFGLSPFKSHRDNLNIKIQGPVQIYDQTGKTIKQQIISGNKKLTGSRKHQFVLGIAGKKIVIR